MSDKQSYADLVREPDTPNYLAEYMQRESLRHIFLAWQPRRESFWDEWEEA